MPGPGVRRRARPCLFYGWVILATSFSITALSTGLSLLFGVFLRTLPQDYGWTTSMISLTYAIFMLSSGMASFAAGRLADRFGPRLVFLCGSLIDGLGILLASQTMLIWHLYLFYGVMTGLGNSAVNITPTIVVSSWFSKAQGLAMGILNAGTGAGPAIFGPLGGYLIMTYGWQDAYISLGLIAWAIALSAFQPSISAVAERRHRWRMPESDREPSMHGSLSKEKRAPVGPPRDLSTFRACAIQGIVMCLVMLTLGIRVAMGDEQEAILSTVRSYITAVYARDYAEAYRWIAAEDRRLKSLADYEQDNDAFKGDTLKLARRLAQKIVIRDPMIERHGDRVKVRARLNLPNGNAEEVSDLLLAEGGFAEAPLAELEGRMAKLEALIASGKLPTVEVEAVEWALVRDPEGWRVFVDWGSGVRIHFATQVPKEPDVAAAFDRAEVLTPRGETVRLRLTVRNHGMAPVRLKVVHHVEPAALEQQLDLVQCGYLLPRDIAAGGVDESPVVYFVDEDLPKDVGQLRVTLEFLPAE